MSILKFITRLKRMDRLIRMKATGNPDEFAEKLEISRSTLLENIRDIKLMGGKIVYCRIRQSYCYEEDHSLSITFSRNGLSKEQMHTVHGGCKKVFFELLLSPILSDY